VARSKATTGLLPAAGPCGKCVRFPGGSITGHTDEWSTAGGIHGAMGPDIGSQSGCRVFADSMPSRFRRIERFDLDAFRVIQKACLLTFLHLFFSDLCPFGNLGCCACVTPHPDKRNQTVVTMVASPRTDRINNGSHALICVSRRSRTRVPRVLFYRRIIRN